jgi:hypothetical protein
MRCHGFVCESTLISIQDLDVDSVVDFFLEEQHILSYLPCNHFFLCNKQNSMMTVLYKSVSGIFWSVGVIQHGCCFQVLVQVVVVPESGVLLAAGGDGSKAVIAVE